MLLNSRGLLVSDWRKWVNSIRVCSSVVGLSRVLWKPLVKISNKLLSKLKYLIEITRKLNKKFLMYFYTIYTSIYDPCYW